MTSKLAKAALAAAAVLVLASCSRNNVTYTESTAAYRVSFGAGVYTYVNVWTDPETGCQSYVTDDGFMSPRLTAEGMQRCAAVAPATSVTPSLADLPAADDEATGQ